VAKTQDELPPKAKWIQEAFEAPKSFLQKCFRWSSFLFVLPLAKVYPLSLGADLGRIQKIKREKGNRDAVDFGKLRLVHSLKKLKNRGRFKMIPDEFIKVSTWFLLSTTTEYACAEPVPADLVDLSSFSEQLSQAPPLPESSESLCNLARLAWVLRQPDEALIWNERAIAADNGNAYAHYLKGWYGTVLDRGNPVDSLFEAVRLDPDLLRSMRSEKVLTDVPDILSAVEVRAKREGILVV
jgi:hypothetical protein